MNATPRSWAARNRSIRDLSDGCTLSFLRGRAPPGARLVWLETVILGPVVEPDVQPRHTSAGRAEPHRLLPDAPRHRLTDLLPKGVPLTFRGEPHEGRQVAVGRRPRDRAR